LTNTHGCDVDPLRRTPAWPTARKVRLAHSPHFPGFRPPFGLEQNVILFPRQQATGPGLVGDPNGGQFTGGRFARCPGSRWHARRSLARRRVAPHAERLTRQAVCLLPGIQQTNGFTCTAAIPIAGEPPETRFPWTVSFKVPATVPPLRSGPAVLTFKPTVNPSPIADTAAACAPAAPAPHAANPLNSVLPDGSAGRAIFCLGQKIARPAGQGKQNARSVLRPPGVRAAKQNSRSRGVCQHLVQELRDEVLFRSGQLPDLVELTLKL
jgi:hypothetical protein